MSIAVDSTSNGTDKLGATLTVSHTCASGALLVVNVASTDGVTTPTVTYNGDAMTMVASINGSQMSSFMFVLVSADSGTHDIVATKDIGVDYGLSAISFTGAAGYSAFNSANGNSGTASLTTTTATTGNGVVVTGGAKNQVTTVTYTGSGTEFENFNDVTAQVYVAAYTNFTAGSDVTESWTFTSAKWALTSVEIYEPSAAATGGFFFAVDR